MLSKGSTNYGHVDIKVEGFDATVGFRINRSRGKNLLTGYWRFPDGEWQKVNEHPIYGTGAKGKIISMASDAIRPVCKGLLAERDYREQQVFVICGPSCGGKPTLKEVLTMRHRNRFCTVTTTTTRPVRKGEQDEVDYQFLSREEFETRLAAAEFLEHDEVNGELYGVERSQLGAAEGNGRSTVLVTTPKGIQPIREWCRENRKSLTTVFVTAPTELLIERLLLRFRQDSEAKVKAYAARLRRLLAEEVEWINEADFDIVVESDTLEARENAISRILGVCEIGVIRHQLKRNGLNKHEQARLLA